MAEGPELEPTDNATVLPVFPLNGIYWPGTEVQLNIIDPSYRRMYDDLLASGARRFVVPFTRSLSGGRVRYAEMPEEDRRLHAVGSVLFLDDLREVGERTGGRVKYIASHTVRGRARLKTLLNPNALFKTDENGNKVDYLRAEVELVQEPEILKEEVGFPIASRARLADAWEELRSLCASLDEPHLQDDGVVRERASTASTWDLAGLWQALQQALLSHRDRAKVMGQVQEWIVAEQRSGRLPQDLPTPVDISRIGMPDTLVEAFVRAQDPGNFELGDMFWNPFLRMLATDDCAARGELLVDLALEEVSLARARAAVQKALG